MYISHKNPEFENVNRKTTGHAIQLFSSFCDQALIWRAAASDIKSNIPWCRGSLCMYVAVAASMCSVSPET